ncbi:hypothetical protein Sru01_65090 [Sphaerisporangium rufum]|uniref:FtsX extracellular domain-containing protein n=1 Tax=Sphaerisporangium rufum TaxID=1381558 RepID=A0A919R8C5_9ACTN|nr:permease-like cell division protein FtsX [Sphaerisporangium rufum]GII81527.1 hypothetical protein Sru01_65090 [Sphaerisporangium rufum]
MNDERVTEDRLRDALRAAAGTMDVHTVRPLTAPRRRRPSRTPMLAAAAVTLIALTGVVGYDRLTAVRTPVEPAAAAPSAAPGTIWAGTSKRTAIIVFLCKRNDAFEACQGRAAITAAEKKHIERTLRKLPGVRELRFESQETAYGRFLEAYGDDNAFARTIKITDLPESLRLKIAVGADRRAILDAARVLPGVSNVVDETDLPARTGG